MSIKALCVCVNYSHLLVKSLARWRDGVEQLTIITSSRDKATRQLCQEFGVKLHVTDIFYALGARFNKGAALSEAALAAGFYSDSDWLLTFDADMVPPENWRSGLNRYALQPGNIYGTYRYSQPEDAVTPVVDPAKIMHQEYGVIGFFMLFHASDPVLPKPPFPLFDLHWPHAGNYDTTFVRRWPANRRKLIETLPLIHLGEERQNWNGRSQSDKQQIISMLQQRSGPHDWAKEQMPIVPTIPGLLSHMKGIVLSVLICSLEVRKASLDRLLARLKPQIDGRQDVELLVDSDCGQVTTGFKRNRLLAAARGAYVCFIDDDDMVSDDYVRGIMDSLSSCPDCVSIGGKIIVNGRKPQALMISLRHKPQGYQHRQTNHLTPIRRDTVMAVGGFADVASNEDVDFGYRVRPLLSVEAITAPTVQYHYNFDASNSATHHAPPGYLYRNAFGGSSFIFEVDVQLKAAARLRCQINDSIMTTDARAGKLRCRFIKAAGMTSLLVNGVCAGYALTPASPVKVLIRAAPHLELLGVTECQIDDKRVKLSIKKPIIL